MSYFTTAKIINMAVIVTMAMLRQAAGRGFFVTHCKPFTCSGIHGTFCHELAADPTNWEGETPGGISSAQASSACRLLLVNLIGPLAKGQAMMSEAKSSTGQISTRHVRLWTGSKTTKARR
jgi:hypothetical protein